MTVPAGSEQQKPLSPEDTTRTRTEFSAGPKTGRDGGLDIGSIETLSSQLAESIGAILSRRGESLAVAESLTGGQISTTLAAVPESSDWFAGSVVAYRPETKFRILGVPEGPVVTEEAARVMAETVAERMGVEYAVATTGSGGPEPQEGEEPGTTWIAVTANGNTEASLHELSTDDTERIVALTVNTALQAVHNALQERASEDTEHVHGAAGEPPD